MSCRSTGAVGLRTHRAAKGVDARARRVRRPAAPVPSLRGAVLLEVVLALTVFVAMAMAVLGGLAMAVRSARHLQLETRAANLAVTLLSEMELGLVPVEDAGPETYEDEALEDWTWEVTVQPVTSELPELEMTTVEVIIRHTTAGYTYRAYRLMTETAGEGEEFG